MTACQNKPTNSTPALDHVQHGHSRSPPTQSFYQYATGGWQAKQSRSNPNIRATTSFNVLSDNNEIRINELFTQMTKENACAGHASIRRSPTSTSWASTRYV